MGAVRFFSAAGNQVCDFDGVGWLLFSGYHYVID